MIIAYSDGREALARGWGPVRTRSQRVVLSIVIVATALAAIPTEVVPGEALPDSSVTRDDIKAHIFARCARSEFRSGAFQPGAMAEISGKMALVASTRDDRVVSCGVGDKTVSSGVVKIEHQPDVIADLGGIGEEDGTGYIGFGRVAAEVVAVEVIAPDGRLTTAEVAGETYAYAVPDLPSSDTLELIIRAKDRTGAVIREFRIQG
jgi:hypothetical protein